MRPSSSLIRPTAHFATPNLYNPLKFNPVYTANHAKISKNENGCGKQFHIYLCHLVVKLLNNLRE